MQLRRRSARTFTHFSVAATPSALKPWHTRFLCPAGSNGKCKIPNFDVQVTARSVCTDCQSRSNSSTLVVHLARDITQRKQQEDLLHNLLRVQPMLAALVLAASTSQAGFMKKNTTPIEYSPTRRVPEPALEPYCWVLMVAHNCISSVRLERVSRRRTLESLFQRFQPLIRRNPSLLDPPRERGVTCLAPRLVAQIAFQEWTADRKLRQPVFLGLRNGA